MHSIQETQKYMDGTPVKMDDVVQNTCRAHAHRMHTSNATKMTNHQVITVSAD